MNVDSVRGALLAAATERLVERDRSGALFALELVALLALRVCDVLARVFVLRALGAISSPSSLTSQLLVVQETRNQVRCDLLRDRLLLLERQRDRRRSA